MLFRVTWLSTRPLMPLLQPNTNTINKLSAWVYLDHVLLPGLFPLSAISFLNWRIMTAMNAATRRHNNISSLKRSVMGSQYSVKVHKRLFLVESSYYHFHTLVWCESTSWHLLWSEFAKYCWHLYQPLVRCHLQLAKWRLNHRRHDPVFSVI